MSDIKHPINDLNYIFKPGARNREAYGRRRPLRFGNAK